MQSGGYAWIARGTIHLFTSTNLGSFCLSLADSQLALLVASGCQPAPASGFAPWAPSSTSRAKTHCRRPRQQKSVPRVAGADAANDDDVCFIPSFRLVDFVVQLHIQGATIGCAHALSGDEIASWTLVPADARIRVFRTVEQFVQPGGRRLAIVLQDGSLVTSQRWASIAWIL